MYVLHVFQKKSKRGIATPKQDIENYVREQLWEKQKLPIRVHAGVSLDAVVSGKTAEDTKRFYRKNGFKDEEDGKHLVNSPQEMSV